MRNFDNNLNSDNKVADKIADGRSLVRKIGIRMQDF